MSSITPLTYVLCVNCMSAYDCIYNEMAMPLNKNLNKNLPQHIVMVDFAQCSIINIWISRLNHRHFAADILKYIFFNVNVWISLKISPKLVPKVQINNFPELVQIMPWCRPGNGRFTVSLGLNKEIMDSTTLNDVALPVWFFRMLYSVTSVCIV